MRNPTVDQQGRWVERDPSTVTCRMVSVCCLQSGQARPYGDSWYRYRVMLRAGMQAEIQPLRVDRATLLAMIAPLVGERLYERVDAPSAFAAVIETCDETEPGHWLVEARALYND